MQKCKGKPVDITIGAGHARSYFRAFPEEFAQVPFQENPQKAPPHFVIPSSCLQRGGGIEGREAKAIPNP